jgi:hypothetical protein
MASDDCYVAKEQTVLQGTIDRLIENGTCNGMEMNLEKTKVKRISRELLPLHIMINQKQLENVEYINYLGSMVTNDVKCAHEIKSSIAIAK